MKRQSILVLAMLILLAMTNIASADTFGTGSNQFNIDFVNISGATNPTSGYGIVNNDYRMGTYEITNDQWNKFVNSYGTVTGSPTSAYDENPFWTGTNVPTNNVSWYEAAQFVNYLNTSTGHQAAYKFAGTQGTGDYTFAVWESGDVGYDAVNPFRNSNAAYFMPTENEWVKAAYWNGTSLQEYATIGDSIPVAGVDTNYDNAVGQPWDVGSGSEELNGTFDMMGNVFEWMESPWYSGDYKSGSSRHFRGSSYTGTGYYLRSSNRYGPVSPYNEHIWTGFRVASVTVPAPAPVADAGPDQTVFATEDGIAQVTLDGSGSSDPDDDELTYEWTWSIGEDTYNATGINPTIELPIGEHTIQLIVNDGTFDSEPDYVEITVLNEASLSEWVFMPPDAPDIGYSLDEGDLLCFFSWEFVMSFNLDTGEWLSHIPMGWIYVDWPFYYELDTGASWFALPPVGGIWVYHFSTNQWAMLPRIIPW